MKISELIRQLQEAQTEHGDLDVEHTSRGHVEVVTREIPGTAKIQKKSGGVGPHAGYEIVRPADTKKFCVIS